MLSKKENLNLKDAYMFMVYLRSAYPIKKNVSLRVAYLHSEFIEKGIMPCNGTVRFERADKAVIRIASLNKTPKEVFTTLAHEYKHCLQVWNEGWTPCFDKGKEKEADSFADTVVGDYSVLYNNPDY